jgi:glycine betaine/proline transport system substrate-binding protein
MTELELKRGYEVLPDNNVRFGIRVINNSDYAISDVKVILDYNESLFMLEVPRTAKFVLKPLGCIHTQRRDYSNHTLQRPPVAAAHAGDACQGSALCLPISEREINYTG